MTDEPSLPQADEESPEAVLLRALSLLLRGAGSDPLAPAAAPVPEPLLSVADAAGYLNVSTTTVRNLAIGGKLRSARIGDRIRFRRAWLDAWIDEGGGEVPAPPPPEPRAAPARAQAARPPRPARPKSPPKPKPPTCIQSVNGVELRLLSDAGRGTVYTWHAGDTRPLCGADGRWSRSLRRCPVATFCARCLTALAAMPGTDLSLFGIGHVYMLRMTTRGATPTPIRAGYHEGDGAKTLCGKREGPWALTERKPQTRECFDCDHRVRWRNRDLDSSFLVPRPMTPLCLLVDAGPLDPRVVDLAARHPGAVEVRQAAEPLPEDFSWQWARWDPAFAAATPVGSFQAPDASITGPRTHWTKWTLSDRSDVGTQFDDKFADRMEDWATTVERAYALYARWHREVAPRRAGRQRGGPGRA